MLPGGQVTKSQAVVGVNIKGVAAPLRMVMDFPLFDAIGPDTDDDPRRKLVRVIDRRVAGGAQYQQVAVLQVSIVDCNDFAVGFKRLQGRR